MSTLNPFELLVDDDAEDPALLLAALQKAAAPAKATAQSQPAAKPSAKLPAKPLPPAQAVRESRNEGQRGGRGGARGRGGRGFGRDSVENVNKFENGNGYSGGYNRRTEDGDAGKAPSERRQYGGPRGGGAAFRGGDRNGESEEGDRPRRPFERRSGTGRGNEIKREGAGRGNWGTPNEEIVPEIEEPTTEVKKVESEKKSGEEETDDANKDSSTKEKEEKEAEEEKEMTLEEYEKVLEEKRKTLLSMKSEARKVNVDKELESMQLLSNKKIDHDDVFIKLGSDKDKRKEAAEKAKKSVSINEFLKPAEGEKYNRGGGRGRGRGRGREGGVGGGFGRSERAPAIEDVAQFPSLGGKSN